MSTFSYPPLPYANVLPDISSLRLKEEIHSAPSVRLGPYAMTSLPGILAAYLYTLPSPTPYYLKIELNGLYRPRLPKKKALPTVERLTQATLTYTRSRDRRRNFPLGWLAHASPLFQRSPALAFLHHTWIGEGEGEWRIETMTPESWGRCEGALENQAEQQVVATNRRGGLASPVKVGFTWKSAWEDQIHFRNIFSWPPEQAVDNPHLEPPLPHEDQILARFTPPKVTPQPSPPMQPPISPVRTPPPYPHPQEPPMLCDSDEEWEKICKEDSFPDHLMPALFAHPDTYRQPGLRGSDSSSTTTPTPSHPTAGPSFLPTIGEEVRRKGTRGRTPQHSPKGEKAYKRGRKDRKRPRSSRTVPLSCACFVTNQPPVAPPVEDLPEQQKPSQNQDGQSRQFAAKLLRLFGSD